MELKCIPQLNDNMYAMHAYIMWDLSLNLSLSVHNNQPGCPLGSEYRLPSANRPKQYIEVEQYRLMQFVLIHL